MGLADDDGSKLRNPFTRCSDASFLRNWLALFLLGTLNNLGYVVVNSASYNLAVSFGETDLLPLIPWANVAAGFFVRGLNTFALEKVSYRLRVIVTGFSLAVGLLILIVSIVFGSFWVSLCGIVLIGGSSSFGESVLLGFLRQYPSDLVEGWSSGTGMAGVAGSALYLLLVALDVSLAGTFVILLPTVLLYWLAFFLGMSKPQLVIQQQPFAVSEEADVERVGLLQSDGDQDLQPVVVEGVKEPSRAKAPLGETSIARYIRCTRIVAWWAFQLGAVYCFEYVASSGMAAKADDQYDSTDGYAKANAFAILSFCYQLGVLLSRSSLSFIKIRLVEILTVLQLINAVYWSFEAYFKFTPVWLQFILMFYVGLLGGASYVNVFYLVLHDKDSIPDADRDLCVNLAALAITAGITASSIWDLIADYTFLANV